MGGIAGRIVSTLRRRKTALLNIAQNPGSARKSVLIVVRPHLRDWLTRNIPDLAIKARRYGMERQ